MSEAKQSDSTDELGDDARRNRNLLRRVERARRFPDNTCPASRHVHLMAKDLLRGNAWWFTDPVEREHVAGSLLSVLESLFKARTELERLKSPNTANEPRPGVGSI